MRFLSIHSINYPEYLLNKAIFSLPIFESQFQTPYVQYLPKTVLYSTVGNKIPSICNTTVNETILEAIVWCSAVSKKCVAGSIWRNMTLISMRCMWMVLQIRTWGKKIKEDSQKPLLHSSLAQGVNCQGVRCSAHFPTAEWKFYDLFRWAWLES